MTESGQPSTTKSSASTLIVRIVLFLILAVLLGALGYEYAVPRRESAAAMERLDKLDGEKVGAGEFTTDEDVHKAIGFDPQRETPNKVTLFEHYAWMSVVPGRTHDLWVVYQKSPDGQWMLAERKLNEKPEPPEEGPVEDLEDAEGMAGADGEGFGGGEGLEGGRRGGRGGGEGFEGGRRGGRGGGEGRGRGGRGRGRPPGENDAPVADSDAPTNADDQAANSDAPAGDSDVPAGNGDKPSGSDEPATSEKPETNPEKPAPDSSPEKQPAPSPEKPEPEKPEPEGEKPAPENEK